MTKSEFITTVTSKLALLDMTDKPTVEQATQWLDAITYESKGRVRLYVRAPKKVSIEAEAALKLIRWHFGPGNLGPIMSIRWMVPRDVLPKIETLATLIAVLSGRTTATDKWSAALGRQ